VKNFTTDEATSRAMVEQFRVAFNEDKTILEAIHRKEKQPRAWRPVRLAIDAAPVRMRRMVESMIEAEPTPQLASDANAA
jgi:vanillate O-demethylase monooxygenase subunit